MPLKAQRSDNLPTGVSGNLADTSQGTRASKTGQEAYSTDFLKSIAAEFMQ